MLCNQFNILTQYPLTQYPLTQYPLMCCQAAKDEEKLRKDHEASLATVAKAHAAALETARKENEVW